MCDGGRGVTEEKEGVMVEEEGWSGMIAIVEEEEQIAERRRADCTWQR